MNWLIPVAVLAFTFLVLLVITWMTIKGPPWTVNRMRVVGLVTLIGAVFGISGQTTTAQVREVQQTEVVLIGGIHFNHLFHPDNSPAHLRALLRHLEPDVIALENPPEWQEEARHYWTYLPEYYVGELFAEENGLPVEGIDWYGPLDVSQSAWIQMIPTLDTLWANVQESSRRFWSYGAMHARLAYGERTDWALPAVQAQVTLDMLDDFGRRFYEDSTAQVRDDSIAANIRRLAKRYPGQRIAVLIGSAHLYPQRVRLEQFGDIQWLPAHDFLPSEAEVQQALTPGDAKLLLGANLDSWLVPAIPQCHDQRRSKALLDFLTQVEPEQASTTYFTAKWHQLFGGFAEAGRLLDQIITDSPPDTLPWTPNSEWSWPPWQSITAKAIFVRATIYDMLGDHDTASSLYRQLLESVPEYALKPRVRGPLPYYDLRWYLNSLIRHPYRGGTWESLRVWAAIRSWSPQEIPANAWPR